MDMDVPNPIYFFEFHIASGINYDNDVFIRCGVALIWCAIGLYQPLDCDQKKNEWPRFTDHFKLWG